MATPNSTSVTESTCDNPDCTFNGPEFYSRDGQHLCGACMDRLDDENMPFMVSEFSYRLLKEMDAR